MTETRSGEASSRQRPLTSEQQELVRAAQGMVDKIARSLARRASHLGFEDLRSLGHEGLVEAAQNYDPSFGVPFEGFAWPRVHGAMRNGLERERTQLRALVSAGVAASYRYAEAQLDEGDPMHDSEEDVSRRLDRGCDGIVAAMVTGFFTASARLEGEESVVRREAYANAIASLREASASLPERDRTILALHYDGGLDLKQVAATLGVSYISARRYHHAAMDRLGARLRARGIKEPPPAEGRSP